MNAKRSCHTCASKDADYDAKLRQYHGTVAICGFCMQDQSAAGNVDWYEWVGEESGNGMAWALFWLGVVLFLGASFFVLLREVNP